MNKKKIAIIINVQDEKKYQECFMYLENLIVPNDFGIEFIPIINVGSVAEAYQKGMNLSDAKYKVYLKDTVRIICKNILQIMLERFKVNDELAMLGMVGIKQCPTHGDWWLAKEKYGQVYLMDSDKLSKLDYGFGDVNEVDLLLDTVLMTQVDFSWRADIFELPYFYDFARSIENKRCGYKNAVIRLDLPGCIIENSLQPVFDKELPREMFIYDEAKERFLDEYSVDVFPLVSIWIPTHNRPEYLKISLGCALAQTYRNVEVCISDNSDDEKTAEFIRPYLLIDKRIKYFHARTPEEQGIVRQEFDKYAKDNLYHYSLFDKNNIAPAQNWWKAWSLTTGQYLSSLCDDDWIHPRKASKVMKYYLEDESITLVTSPRYVFDDQGYFEEGLSQYLNIQIGEDDIRLDGKVLARMVLLNLRNFIGENVFHNRKYAEHKMIYGYYNNHYYSHNGDNAAWLHLLSKGKAVFLADWLSGFRLGANNLQQHPDIAIAGIVEWFFIGKNSYLDNYIENREEMLGFFKLWKDAAQFIVNKYKNNDIKPIIQCYEKIDKFSKTGVFEED